MGRGWRAARAGAGAPTKGAAAPGQATHAEGVCHHRHAALGVGLDVRGVRAHCGKGENGAALREGQQWVGGQVWGEGICAGEQAGRQHARWQPRHRPTPPTSAHRPPLPARPQHTPPQSRWGSPPVRPAPAWTALQTCRVGARGHAAAPVSGWHRRAPAPHRSPATAQRAQQPAPTPRLSPDPRTHLPYATSVRASSARDMRAAVAWCSR